MPAPPRVVAMLVCDHAHRDATTAKHTLIGTFDIYRAPSFPVTIPIGIYLKITNMNGRYQFAIKMTDASNEQELGRIDYAEPVTITDPLFTGELSQNLPKCTLPRAGKFLFQFLANGELIHDVGVTAVEVEDPS